MYRDKWLDCGRLLAPWGLRRRKFPGGMFPLGISFLLYLRLPGFPRSPSFPVSPCLSSSWPFFPLSQTGSGILLPLPLLSLTDQQPAAGAPTPDLSSAPAFDPARKVPVTELLGEHRQGSLPSWGPPYSPGLPPHPHPRFPKHLRVPSGLLRTSSSLGFQDHPGLFNYVVCVSSIPSTLSGHHHSERALCMHTFLGHFCPRPKQHC